MTEETICRLLDKCRSIVKGSLPLDNGVNELREILVICLY